MPNSCFGRILVIARDIDERLISNDSKIEVT
jgi:hypothetical protein